MTTNRSDAASGPGTEVTSRHGATGSVQVTSRSLHSYRRMFCLGDEDITGRRILDCPAGASSFGAQVRLRGGSVVSVDSVYLSPVAQIEATVRRGIAATPAFAEHVGEALDWNTLGSVDALVNRWETAADLFLNDYAHDPGHRHYVPAVLPDLPFPDRSFDLAVSGFLLFYYSDVLGLDDHVRALEELTRVAAEVRVHPLVDSAGRPSPHLDDAMQILRDRGIDGVRKPSEASDLRAAEEMLVLRRR